MDAEPGATDKQNATGMVAEDHVAVAAENGLGPGAGGNRGVVPGADDEAARPSENEGDSCHRPRRYRDRPPPRSCHSMPLEIRRFGSEFPAPAHSRFFRHRLRGWRCRCCRVRRFHHRLPAGRCRPTGQQRYCFHRTAATVLVPSTQNAPPDVPDTISVFGSGKGVYPGSGIDDIIVSARDAGIGTPRTLHQQCGVASARRRRCRHAIVGRYGDTAGINRACNQLYQVGPDATAARDRN